MPCHWGILFEVWLLDLESVGNVFPDCHEHGVVIADEESAARFEKGVTTRAHWAISGSQHRTSIEVYTRSKFPDTAWRVSYTFA